MDTDCAADAGTSSPRATTAIIQTLNARRARAMSFLCYRGKEPPARPAALHRAQGESGSGDLHDLAAACEIQIRVALHLVAERLVGGVIPHARFERADVVGLVFKHDAVEVTRQVRQDAGCGPKRRFAQGVLQLSGQLAGLPGFCDEAVSHDNHGGLRDMKWSKHTPNAGLPGRTSARHARATWNAVILDGTCQGEFYPDSGADARGADRTRAAPALDFRANDRHPSGC